MKVSILFFIVLGIVALLAVCCIPLTITYLHEHGSEWMAPTIKGVEYIEGDKITYTKKMWDPLIISGVFVGVGLLSLVMYSFIYAHDNA